MTENQHRWRVRGAVVVLAAISASLAAVTLPERNIDACPDGDEVATVDGVTLCTHGSDAGPVATPAEPEAPTEAARARAVACVGNGTSGSRVQAVYARVAGQADRFATLSPSLQSAAAAVEHLVNRSAAQTGGERHVRWVTSAQAASPRCSVSIQRVTVPSVGATDFAAMVRSLVDQGLDRRDRKYLVWVDSPATGCAGIATFLTDDRPGQENFNNTSIGYARVDESCLAGDGQAETHELMHLLGAVQRSAPHASPSGHCSDEWDLLCYDDDGSGSFRTSVRCPTRANDRRLDCNDDDYFSTSPAPGSYLATHWNAANSRYLEKELPVFAPDPGTNPPPNDAFTAAPLLPGYAGATPGTLAGATLEEDEPDHASRVAGSTWYKWRPRVDGPVSVDTRGSTGDTVLAVYTGSALSRLARVATSDDAVDLAPQSRVTFNAVAGTTYRIAVSGRGDPVGVTLRWGPPPHGFTDVSPGARNDNAVGWAAATGVMRGVTATTWRPRDTVTRGQAIAALWRFVGSPTRGSTTPLPFTDVGPATPYRTALEWAVGAGVVPRSSTFRPQSPLNRAALASWTWAAVGRPADAPAVTFTDLAASSPFARKAGWAVTRQLTPAFDDGTFRRTATVSRSKLAVGLFGLAGDPAAWTSFAGDDPSTVVF